MRLSDSQHGVLNTLREFGPQMAIEVHGPRDMSGKRKVKLEWHCAPGPTLAKLESAGLVTVQRAEPVRPVNAVGKPGHPRVALTITITDAGRAALA